VKDLGRKPTCKHIMIAPNHRASEDTSTVQVSDANSLLGSHLIEGDWTEALEHLSTPEGARDANADDNPLGLHFSSYTKHHADDIPRTKTSALFAALFVRAPFDVVSKIYEIMDRGQFKDEDLAYTLSIIPSEEEERLMSHPRQRIPYRSRAWSFDEYNEILSLFLQHYSMHQRTSSSLLHKCDSWILPFPLTPLCIAAYNPDVSDETLRKICILEPRAVDIECKLFGVQTLPFVIAAASPVPPKPSVGVHVSISRKYSDAMERRWRKVKCLIVGSDCYIGNNDLSVSPPLLEPSVDQVCKACDEAIQRNEWEIVREFLKRQEEGIVIPVVQAQLENTNMKGDGMDVDIPFSPVATAAAEPLNQVQCVSSSLEKFRKALAEHDRNTQAQIQKQQKERAKDDWVHKNMGVVMYPIDAVVDVATSIIPRSWRKRHGGDRDVAHVIVSPMS
jgi:hypothetical protein